MESGDWAWSASKGHIGRLFTLFTHSRNSSHAYLHHNLTGQVHVAAGFAALLRTLLLVLRVLRVAVPLVVALGVVGQLALAVRMRKKVGSSGMHQ